MSGPGTVHGAAIPERSRRTSVAGEWRWSFAVWAAMLGWSVALFIIARSYYLDFELQRYDLGNMVQAVWSTAQGRPLETTLSTGEQVVRLASHVDPILALLAPLWLVWPSPLLLAGVQIIACALGALPVFWLGRRHLESEKAAALITLAYLAYPWLAWTAVDAMHPVTLAIPLFLYAIWFLDSGRLVAFAFSGLLIVGTGELMGVMLACLGVWYWLARGQRRTGFFIAAVGFTWSVLAIKVIVPHFYGDESLFFGYYASVGGSPEGVVRTLFTDPGAIVDALVTHRDLIYLLSLTVPLAGAFLLAPLLAVGAIPQLAVNGLSSVDSATDPSAHNVAGVIPFLMAASVIGLGRLPGARRLPAAATVLALCIGLSLYGPWPMPGPRPPALTAWYYGTPSDDHIHALRAAIALVPDGAPVSATNKVGSHLSARRYFFSVPLIANAEWVVLDMEDPWIPLPPPETPRSTWGRQDPSRLAAFRMQLETSPAWREVFERSDVLVFRRVQT